MSIRIWLHVVEPNGVVKEREFVDGKLTSGVRIAAGSKVDIRGEDVAGIQAVGGPDVLVDENGTLRGSAPARLTSWLEQPTVDEIATRIVDVLRERFPGADEAHSRRARTSWSRT